MSDSTTKIDWDAHIIGGDSTTIIDIRDMPRLDSTSRVELRDIAGHCQLCNKTHFQDSREDFHEWNNAILCIDHEGVREYAETHPNGGHDEYVSNDSTTLIEFNDLDFPVCSVDDGEQYTGPVLDAPISREDPNE